jgi:hypothetical protein
MSSSNKENTLTIISYINAMRTEVNLSDNYRKDLGEKIIVRLAQVQNPEHFSSMAQSLLSSGVLKVEGK